MNEILETERILFARLSESLVPDYLKMVNDLENVGRLIGRTEPVTEEKELKWVRKKLEAGAPVFSMLEKESGEFIGNIEFMDVHDRVGELGIAITAGKQDMGYGSEAIPAMVDHGMNALGLERVFLKVFPDNARAIKVYLKCGFREYDRTERDVFMEIVRENDGAEGGGDCELIRPTEEHLGEIASFREEFEGQLDWIHGARGLRYRPDPAEWLAYSRGLSDEASLPEGVSPYTQFVYVRKADGRIVGMIGVQHKPEAPFETWGGHVGYCVRPSERRRGYCARMLRAVLPFCKSQGLERILLTAGDENQGSVRTILKNGGKLENYVISPRHGIPVGRYWIDLKDIPENEDRPIGLRKNQK